MAEGAVTLEMTPPDDDRGPGDDRAGGRADSLADEAAIARS
jgi:hypothetical protein